jgi:hypothetical protein
MNTTWKVRIEDGVLEELLSRRTDPLVRAVLNEWLLVVCRTLTESEGYPPDVFPVRSTELGHLGAVFERRLLALYYHQRTRYRTWRNLWLWPFERCEIVVTWLVVLPPR